MDSFFQPIKFSDVLIRYFASLIFKLAFMIGARFFLKRLQFDIN